MTVERAGWDPVWREFESEVARQTFADGGSREQAGGYFLYVLEIIWVAALFGHAVGQDLRGLAGRVEAMLGWLQAIAGEDGEPPDVGDDAEDRFIRVDYFERRSASAIAGAPDGTAAGGAFPRRADGAERGRRVSRTS